MDNEDGVIFSVVLQMISILMGVFLVSVNFDATSILGVVGLGLGVLLIAITVIVDGVTR